MGGRNTSVINMETKLIAQMGVNWLVTFKTFIRLINAGNTEHTQLTETIIW